MCIKAFGRYEDRNFNELPEFVGLVNLVSRL